MKDTKQQQLDLALGIIRELLQITPKEPNSGKVLITRNRAKNFLMAMEEGQ